MRWLIALVITTSTALAQGDRAGAFDYYVLALSWTPNWCALEGDARASEQCGTDRGLGWTLHGLWPQYETGWPSYCTTARRNPSRAETGAMRDIMGTGGLAWYQWKKHGRCSGLSSQAYFQASRQAYEAVARPPVFRKVSKRLKLSARVVEEAFLQSNPELSPDMITVTCKDRRIQEVRICLTKGLEPRVCGADVRRDCDLGDALFDPIR